MMRRCNIYVAFIILFVFFLQANAVTLLETNFDGASPGAGSELENVSWISDANSIIASSTLTSVSGYELSNIAPTGAALSGWTDNVGVDYNLNTGRATPRGFVASFNVASIVGLSELSIGHAHTTNSGGFQVSPSDMTVTLRNITDSTDVFTDTTIYDYQQCFDDQVWLTHSYDLTGIILEAGKDYTLTLTMQNMVGGGAYATWNYLALTAIDPLSPTPGDGENHIDPSDALGWDILYMDDFVPLYKVYQGAVSGNLSLVSTQSTREYQPVSPLEESTLYYWRVDIIDDSTTPNTVYPGHEWNFMTSGPASTVLNWKLEGSYSSGDDLLTADSSGSNSHGTMVNYPLDGPVFAEGLVGNSLQLKGVDDSVIVSDPGFVSLEDSDPWSMNLYIKVDRTPKDWTRIANIGESYQRQIFVHRNGEIAFLYKGKGLLLSGKKLVPGSWHMLTVTYTECCLAIYFDGIEAVSKLLPFTESESLNSEANLLAYAHSGNFEGQIDEFTFWNGKLQASQIQLLAATLPVPGDTSIDGIVNLEDLSQINNDWLTDNRQTIDELVLDDMEGYAPGGVFTDFDTRWYASVISDSTVSFITDAAESYQGSQAVKWVYDLQTLRQGGLYCKPDITGPVDLRWYRQLSIWIYKHTGTSGQELVCKLIGNQADGSTWQMAQSSYPGGLDSLPEGEWTQWLIDLDSLHSWDDQSSQVPYDRIDDLAGLYIGVHSDSGGSGTIDLDYITLQNDEAYCDGALRPAADIDGDCDVDLDDFRLFAHYWLQY